MAILAVDSVGNVSCISELFNQKWLKCLYRIFMQSFFFAPVNLQIMCIKYIQNQQNRKLWGNDISIFQMFHACEDERLIAEVLIGFVLSCGHKKCISSVLMCSLQRRDNIIRLSADTDTDDQTVLIQNNRIHLHNMTVCNCFDIQSDTHETKLHLLSYETGTASSVNINTRFGNQQICDPCDLRFVQQSVRFIQKFLISIEFRYFKIRNIFFGTWCQVLLILINKFSVSVKSTFLGET